MTAAPNVVGLAPNIELWGGCKIRVTALDPATGATVTTVKVSNVTVEANVESIGQAESIGAILLAREA